MPSGFQPTDANDAGLLQVAASLRQAADTIAHMISAHNEIHSDHGLTECKLGTLAVADLMSTLGAAVTMGGSNMLSRYLEITGLLGGGDEYWPSE